MRPGPRYAAFQRCFARTSHRGYPRSAQLSHILMSPTWIARRPHYTTLRTMSSPNPPTHVPIDQLFSIQGKTAICTGVTGGLGRELCTTLAEAGVDIVSIQLPDDPAGEQLGEAVRKLGRDFKSFKCDVSDSKALRTCFGDIWAAGVVPDILLNAAGINRRGMIQELQDEDIDAVCGSNTLYDRTRI